jgi:hypothetical protein
MRVHRAGLALPLALWAFAPSTALAEAAPAAKIPTYTLADFTRFEPKTAYDMLVQVPAFTLVVPNNNRGLGQASENVVINGERVTDKAGAVAQLQNVPATDVDRIEIVPAASLGIAGLSGQVANVILKAKTKPVGNWEWKPTVRPLYALPSLLRGTVSYSGALGDLGYNLSLQNRGGRGAIGGSHYEVTDANGAVTERRDQVVHNEFDDARLEAVLNYKGPVKANLTLVYDPYWNSFNNFQRRFDNGDPNDWRTKQKNVGYALSASGDLAFNLGPGELKLIGLDSFEHSPFTALQRDDYDSGAPATGTLFGRDSRMTELVGKVEYRWKQGADEWRVSGERAYNRLDQIGSLANLAADGTFQDTPFPGGSGIVGEERYEGLASLNRPLGDKVVMQMVGGAEYSVLQHLDRTETPRRFLRPKGSLSLAWRPGDGWDVNLKLERRVGQINFYDFLAQQDLVLNRSNDANPLLVPPQSWEVTGEVGRDFGRWGKTRLRLYDYEVEDIVDDIPVGTDGDAVGNLPHATRLGLESTSTVKFDPLGWSGAKVDMTIGAEASRVRDPLTGAIRPISNAQDRWASVELRHDVPGHEWAWGGGFYLNHFGWGYYVGEVNRDWEGPYAAVFAEHKAFAGLKVRLDIFNINDGRNIFDRVVYTGRRTFTPISFEEHSRQVVGPIFTLSLRGAF